MTEKKKKERTNGYRDERKGGSNLQSYTARNKLYWRRSEYALEKGGHRGMLAGEKGGRGRQVAPIWENVFASNPDSGNLKVISRRKTEQSGRTASHIQMGRARTKAGQNGSEIGPLL